MRYLAIFGVIAVLGGCVGKAVVLKEDTAAVSEIIDTSVKTARGYYDEQGEKRYEFIVNYIAERPSCAANSKINILLDENRCLNNEEIAQLRECNERVDQLDKCLKLQRAFELNISFELLQPRQTTVTLIESVAEYQKTLAKSLLDDEYDTASDLMDIKSKFEELENKINDLKGVADKESGEGKDNEFELQAGAVGSVIDLIRKVSESRADYNKLKEAVLTYGPIIDTKLHRLVDTYEKADKPYSDLLTRKITESQRQMYNNLNIVERSKIPLEKRRETINSIYKEDFERTKLASNPDVFAAGIRGLVKAHKKLQEGFKDNLTRDQRKRIAEENLEELKVAFKAMVDLIQVLS